MPIKIFFWDGRVFKKANLNYENVIDIVRKYDHLHFKEQMRPIFQFDNIVYKIILKMSS